MPNLITGALVGFCIIQIFINALLFVRVKAMGRDVDDLMNVVTANGWMPVYRGRE